MASDAACRLWQASKKHCQRRECGWSVVQPDYDGELGPVHGVYGAEDAELELQRTIKKAEFTASLCLLKKNYRPYQGAC